MRVAAVVVFLAFIFAGTYFARVSQSPKVLLGFILGCIGFGLGRTLWRSGNG